MTMIAIKAALSAGWGLLKSVPWQAWALAAVALAFYWHGERRYAAGEAAVMAKWDRANLEADAALAKMQAERDRISSELTIATQALAATAVTETRVETAAAAERIRYVMREIPGQCPGMPLPDLVLHEGRAAVARARAAGDTLRAGGD